MNMITTCLISGISIHVPREGHDAATNAANSAAAAISIHVPREGHDLSVFKWRVPEN